MQQDDWSAFNPQPAGNAVPPPVRQITPAKPKAPEIRTVGNQLGIINPDGSFTPTYTAENPNTAFDNQSNLRKEYNSSPAVKDYGETLKALGGAWNAPDNAQGDLAVIYAFAKVMDPGSVVREGEMDMANSTSSLVQDLHRRYGQITEGNRLPPEVRKQLIQSAMGRGAALNQAYKAERARYRDIAGKAGIDPELILGPHAGDAYRDIGQEFDLKALDVERNPDGSVKVDPNAGQGAIEVDIVGGKPPTPEEVAANPELYAQWYRSQQQPGPGDSFKAGLGDLAEGAGDLLGLVGNPLNAGINWATGSNLSTDLGQTFRDATGLPEGDPLAGAINQGGMAAIGGAGLARGVQAIAPSVARFVEPLAAEPIRQGAAGGGAGAGTELARQNNLHPGLQMAAGVAGGAGAYGGTNALLRMAQPKAVSPVMQAAKDQGVRLRPADVGGATAKKVDSAAAQSAFSASPIIGAAKNTQGDIQAATNRAARSQGETMDIDDAGEAIRTAGKSYSQNQADRIGRVYKRAESRAAGASIKPTQALAFLDEQIARFKAAPQGESIVSDLQSVRDSIAGGVSVSGMRDARTILSQGVYDGKLRSGMEKGLYKQFLGLLSKDIEGGLSAAGRKDALNLFRIADKAWSERIEYIDNVLEPVIGAKKSGEQVLEAVERMAGARGGNAKRLSELLREMPPEHAGNVRATIISRLGKATAGQQNDIGDVFAASTFLTRWNSLSPKGKAILFGNGELRRNLDQIATLANATKETGKASNFSNTAGAALNNAFALGGSAALANQAFSGWGVAIFSALSTAQILTGRLMASPRFTGWLAKVPKNPQALERHKGQLAQIAAREPIIANDISSVQQFLDQAVSSTTRAAASGSDPDRE